MSTPSNFPPFDLITAALKQAQEIDELNIQFKAVTHVSVSDVLSFYCATGDFPTYEQRMVIRIHGIQAVLNVLSPHKLPS